MNQTVIRGRWWCLVLALMVGWMSLGATCSVLRAEDQLEKSNPSDIKIGPDGKLIEAKKVPGSFLTWMIRTSGIFGFLIILVSFAMLAIIMTIALQLRRDNYLPASVIEEFEQQVLAKDYQGAFETAKSSDSFIGRILAAGMGHLGVSYEEAIEQMQQVGEDETMTMEHKIGYLALIGSIAPMLGLLGTVQGMALCFQEIASSTAPKPSELADGIGTALFTTLEGLVVAIPAIIFYSLYKNRLARFLMECGFVAENLMKNFKGITRQAPSRTGGAAPVTALGAKRTD